MIAGDASQDKSPLEEERAADATDVYRHVDHLSADAQYFLTALGSKARRQPVKRVALAARVYSPCPEASTGVQGPAVRNIYRDAYHRPAVEHDLHGVVRLDHSLGR